MKMRVLPLFLIATWLNSQKLHVKLRLGLELGKVNLNKQTGFTNSIYAMLTPQK